MNRNDVARVVVLVSDGHSQDDVIVPAKQLREAGVTLLALGIGEYVNWDGLMEITEDATKTFVNDSVTQFVETFRKLAIGDVCNFAKGYFLFILKASMLSLLLIKVLIGYRRPRS